jgi:hypothetical protein
VKRLEQGAPYRYPVADGVSGWPEKVSDRTTGMHLRAKSDDRIGSRKPRNKAGLHPAVEAVDGRRPTETHSLLSGALQTQARTARRSDCNMCGTQHVGIDVVGSSLLNNTPSASLCSPGTAAFEYVLLFRTIVPFSAPARVPTPSGPARTLRSLGRIGRLAPSRVMW